MTNKMLIETKFNLEGKTLTCITNKYSNFILFKDYEVIVHDRYLDGRPGSFRITDEYHEHYTIGGSDIGKIFRIK